MRTRLLTALFLFFATFLVVPQQSNAEDKAKAVQLLGEGDALLEKGDRYWAANKHEKAIATYEEARNSDNHAYEVCNSPKIYYPIAEAEQKLFLYIEARRCRNPHSNTSR